MATKDRVSLIKFNELQGVIDNYVYYSLLLVIMNQRVLLVIVIPRVSLMIKPGILADFQSLGVG
jgi:hypothetical protein